MRAAFTKYIALGLLAFANGALVFFWQVIDVLALFRTAIVIFRFAIRTLNEENMTGEICTVGVNVERLATLVT